MNTDFLNILPGDADKQEIERIRKQDPYTVLDKLAQAIETKYAGHIHGIVTSTSHGYDPNGSSIKEFAFYLVFENRNEYSYRLFDVRCQLANGSYPIDISAHSNPPTPYQNIEDADNFERVITDILKDEKTRFIILSNYKL
jgi:hypothetical protein